MAKKDSSSSKNIFPPTTSAAGAAAAPAVGDALAIHLSAIQAARAAALAVASRIATELPEILNTRERIEMRLARGRAVSFEQDLQQVEIDLTASGTVVGRLSADSVADLVRLAADLDQSIVRDRLVNLALGTVGQVLDSVVRVKDIVG
jgi:hypothetical protein